MAEIAAAAGLATAGVGIAAMIVQGDPVDNMLILRFSDGEFDENATKIFQSRLQNDSKFRQIAITWQTEFEKQSRTPGGAQTAGRRAKRLEMILRRSPARPAQGSPSKQGPGSERQLKGQQGRGTQKTPGFTASQELHGPQGQSSIQGRTLSPRGHGKAD
ncbi:hypothetical protein EPUS_08568 [Endocarpon pusillum Z07020]|uniref:Uncharacterized protein n=1 Tax=Endocarpon pusillum (strain Z07020 / HMAS-L-300199) TaxID=1263415 RepID=U1HT78_ENDPU|nr:uncharacterized protein EPUS_08568 [Endocarpon pusillum Z07020]ERF73770.1 hypothetical protein EPUS_08568 [Endocarpon pusillum Z07020]